MPPDLTAPDLRNCRGVNAKLAGQHLACARVAADGNYLKLLQLGGGIELTAKLRSWLSLEHLVTTKEGGRAAPRSYRRTTANRRLVDPRKAEALQ